MPKVLSVLALALLMGSSVLGQFIGDGRPHGPRVRPRPPHRQVRAIQVASQKVTVKIKDGVARTTLHQVFHNPNGVQMEGFYMFPLPEQAALSGFSMMMGGKMVQGEVLEKGKAASIYQGIVQRKKDPGLLEYMGKRLFRARVFPIPARGNVEVEMAYDETLHRDGRTLELRIPFRTQSVTKSPVGQTTVLIEVDSTEPMLTVYSPSHEVDIVKSGDHKAKVSYESKQDPGDRDFVLTYGLSKNASVGATVFTHHGPQDGGTFLMLLAPSAELEKGRTQPKDLVFVVDTSGSMAGEKMEQTKKALTYCINRLGKEDRFNVLPFSTEARPWQKTMVNADSEHKDAALSFVKGLQARGGTNINDALVQTMSQGAKESTRPFMVIFLTDGEPTVGETITTRILANVTDANKGLTRLFVFGVGENLKVDLLDLLSEQNHGSREYVGNRESIETKVSSFYDKVASPVLTDVSVQVEGVTLTDLHPRKLSDMFRGTQLMLTGRFRGEGNAVIRLKGKVEGKEIEHVFERKFVAKGKDETAFVARLWAVRHVGWLMDQIRLKGDKKELREEIVRLGKSYGIVTPYTSYLVLEDEGIAQSPGPVRRRGGRRGLDRGGRRGGPGGGGAGGGSTSRGFGGGVPPRPGGLAPGSPSASTGTKSKRSVEVDANKKTRDLVDRLGKAARPQAAPPQADRARAETASADREKEETENSDTFLGGVGEGKDTAELTRLRKKLKKGYFSNAIALSSELKSLRETRTAGGDKSGGLVRRVGSRTFVVRQGLMVETKVLDIPSEDLNKKLHQVEAFSPEYFSLLKKPGLSKILALGNSLLFLDGERVVQIVPEGTLKKAKTEAPPKK